MDDSLVWTDRKRFGVVDDQQIPVKKKHRAVVRKSTEFKAFLPSSPNLDYYVESFPSERDGENL